MPSVEARLARNEVLFRSINERIRELAGRFADDPADPVSFICECSDETCVERVIMTTVQYDEVRALPVRFVVIPGHEAIPLVEQVIFRSRLFSIVRKIGLAGEIARELTPSE